MPRDYLVIQYNILYYDSFRCAYKSVFEKTGADIYPNKIYEIGKHSTTRFENKIPRR